MPVTRNTPLEKRRVKTGCVACRDEKKPQCSNCESRRVSCKYANAADRPSGTYAEIKAWASSLLKILQHSLTPFFCQFINEKSPTIEPVAGSEDRGVASTLQPPRSGVSWQQPPPRTTARHQAPPSSWEAYFDTDLTEFSQRDIALLRQFRYRTAPWLEAGDPDSRFAVAALQMGQRHELIQTLIIELAASHLLRHSKSAPLHDARVGLPELAPDLRLVADTLISLTETLCAGPLAWKQFRLPHSAPSHIKEPLQTLVCQQSRIDLAASILTLAPPATSPDFYLLQHYDKSQKKTATFTAYNWALHHLTACLHFVFHVSAGSPAAAQSPRTPEQISISGAPTDWHTLWLRIQTWYDTRPVEIKSLVDVGSIEMGHIDPANAASFPIHLYSSAMAVQTAVFYHITALLLLQNKPRLAGIPGRRQHLTSPNWHARAIAGVATSNDYAEQWDPIVIASLMYVARNMTHFAQQHAVLECLRTVTSQTGIMLDEEAKQLRAQWATANLVESPLSR
ncbi:Fungal transcriptional regulatory protein [Cordyceps fumosorosea ARSEF 2679]|uniref:Fungal transcriptional regulatory protein n=1 Tax=Cordyceps fumosorosea (strain ARSEF 2679) TaxID=1081104 RepID=A0A167LCB4_CORFA|nr:Fungal transcriptional regulatory protein [Cordyceps fumosorosea ARSEF 2679]OAA52916.1 Fungal transcriptional regulatory protein [Cordyceps fumosorosea ARSEF 2679]